MSNAQSRKMFVNLAAKDLGRSMDFFRGLGFQFDPKFTNDKGSCMIISDEAYSESCSQLSWVFCSGEDWCYARLVCARLFRCGVRSRRKW